MKGRTILLIILASLLLLACLALLLLPRLLDLDRYRDLIEARAEAVLGLDVHLGDLKLSLLPVLGLRIDDLRLGGGAGEGGSELLRARSLRVGARPLPLLRKRLEVTSVRLKEPALALVRRSDGTWNLQDLLSDAPLEAPVREPRTGAWSIASVAVVDGRLTARDLSVPGEKPLQATLTDLDLELRDLTPGAPFRLEAEAALAPPPGGRLHLEGRLGPLHRAPAQPFEVEGKVDLEEVPASTLDRLATYLGLAPRGLFGGAPFSASARIEASLGRERRLAVRDVVAFVGVTEVTGEANLILTPEPELRFRLALQQADFDQLLSALAPQDPDEPLEESRESLRLQAEGTVEIQQGTAATLAFTDLRAGLHLSDGRLELDSIESRLYEGSFRGRVRYDLQTDPPAFEVQGEARGIDTADILEDNLRAEGLVSGRFSGDLAVRGTGSDLESVVRSLAGSGSVQVEDGRIGRLDVLESLSRLTGVFGERTLHSLTRRLETEGTDFRLLQGQFQLRKGKMSFTDLVVDSADFRIMGQGVVDLLTARLDGSFEILFSQEISQSMYTEGSRAGEIFWNPRRGRVELPFRLQGPFAEPETTVDWRAVAGETLTRKIESGLEELLGGERPQGRGAETPPTPVAGGPVVQAATASGSLQLEITRIRWGGSFLVRDLKIEGRVRGKGVDTVSLVVADAAGQVMRRREQLPDVADYLAAATEPEALVDIEWDATVDGKQLLRARFPLTVRVTARNSDGETVEVVREVERR